MSDTDFLLLMVHCEDRANGFEAQHILSTEDRARLREVGIQTAHEQPAWLRVEPSRGEYDFAYLDNIINRNRNAGLKSLIQLAGWRLPAWIPNEWRARQKNGFYEPEMLSIWNEEAQAYSDNYYNTIMDMYADQKDVGFFFGEFQGGEGAMPPSHCYYDDAALEDYKNAGLSGSPDLSNDESLKWFHESVIKHYMRKGKLFYDRNKEIWNEQQRLMDKWNISYGNHVQPEIMRLYRELCPDASLVLLQYTYFDNSHGQDEHDWVDNIVKLSGCDVIAEAMFCAGLPKTTPLAILKGFRGQIVHPVNEFGKHTLEGWEVENIRNSYNQWKEAYENNSDNKNSE